MPKKQTKPKYPKELFAVKASSRLEGPRFLAYGYAVPDGLEGEVAIYKFDRLAKVKRTVTVE